MTIKTTPLGPDTHERLKRIQHILYDRYDVKMSIKDIIAHLIPDPEKGVRHIIEKMKLDIESH